METNGDVLFPSLEEALAWAYRTEAKKPIKVSSAFRDLRGGSVEGPRGLTPLERVAQASFIRSMVRESIAGMPYLAVEGRYMVPADPELKHTKETRVILLAQEVLWQNPHLPRFYVLDVTRKWARMRPDHDEKWWAKHLEKAPSTLRRWRRNPIDQRHPGIQTLLEHWLRVGQYGVEPRLKDGGIIPA